MVASPKLPGPHAAGRRMSGDCQAVRCRAGLEADVERPATDGTKGMAGPVRSDAPRDQVVRADPSSRPGSARPTDHEKRWLQFEFRQV